MSDATWKRIGQVSVAIGALGTTGLLYVTLIAPRAGLEARITVVPFSNPVEIAKYFDDMSSTYRIGSVARSFLSSHGDTIPFDTRIAVADSLAEALVLPPELSLPRRGSYLQAEVLNTGDQIARGVTLQVPYLSLVEVTRVGQESNLVPVSELIQLDSVRPKEVVGLKAWTEVELPDLYLNQIILGHDSGIGKIEFEIPAARWPARLGSFLTSPFLWFSVALWVTIMFLLTVPQRLAKRSPSTPEDAAETQDATSE